MKRKGLLLLIVPLIINLIFCHSIKDKNRQRNSSDIHVIMTPILSPAASLKAIQAEKEFIVKLVASEPLINTPIAMAFDDRLRRWVVEMTDYQPINEDGKEYQMGRIQDFISDLSN